MPQEYPIILRGFPCKVTRVDDLVYASPGGGDLLADLYLPDEPVRPLPVILFLHAGVFAVWIVLNVPPLVHTKVGGFDPFPFGLLTMAVSLEAIFLSVFVLLSQSRQVERDKRRNDIEFDVNLKSEMQIAHMHEKIDHINEELLMRLERLEKK